MAPGLGSIKCSCSSALVSLACVALLAHRARAGKENSSPSVDQTQTRLISQHIVGRDDNMTRTDVAVTVDERGQASPAPARVHLSPSNYTLSRHAHDLGIDDSNAKLSGGGAEWPLFANGKAPEEIPGDTRDEALRLNDPSEHCAAGDIAGYSFHNVSDPSMVPFILPKDHPGRRTAAIIIAPGGGCRYLSWNKEGTQAAKWLNSIGVSAFVLKYRVPCNTPETAMRAVIDGQRAITMVRHRAAEFDFTKVGFMGFSAGGHLSASLGGMSERAYSPIDNIDDVADMADSLSFRPDFSMLVYAASGDLKKVDAKTPPTFIAIAVDDPCVPTKLAEAFYGALVAVSGQRGGHELHIFSAGNHGYGECSLFVHGNSWLPACGWTLNAQLFIENILGVQRPLKALTLAVDSLSQRMSVHGIVLMCAIAVSLGQQTMP